MWCRLACVAALAAGRLEPVVPAATDDASPPAIDGPIDAPAADPDLLVHIKFEEPDFSAGVSDSAGTLGAGSCSAPRCSTSVAGVFGNAAQFDGVDDALSFATSTALDFGSASQPFTVTMWYQAAALPPPTQQVLMAQATEGGSVSFQLSWEPVDGGAALDMVWKVCQTDCQTGVHAIVNDLDDVGRWVFIAGGWDGSDTKLYVDATLLDGVPKSTITFDGSPFMVGADFESGGAIEDSFNGAIDDLRVYRRSLSDAELSALRAEGAE